MNYSKGDVQQNSFEYEKNAFLIALVKGFFTCTNM